MTSIRETDAFKAFVGQELKELKSYDGAYKRQDIGKLLNISSIANYVCKLSDDDCIIIKGQKNKLLKRSGVCKIISMMKKKPDKQKLDYFEYKDGEFTIRPNFEISKKQIKTYFKGRTFTEGDDFITVEECKFLFTYTGNECVADLAKQHKEYKIISMPVVQTINGEYRRFISILINECLNLGQH
jgi:hypothetical protein